MSALNTSHLESFLFDVRLWIVVLLLIRLENINLPPLDEHSWRQSMTLGVARNYAEVDANLFHPRTIVCDSRGGILAQEFPLFNYCIFLLWQIFGEQNWCFRFFNLLIASVGLWAFSEVAKRLVSSRAALFATVMFGVSVAFMYARKGMPDVFAVSLAIIGVHCGYLYVEKKKTRHLFVGGILIALGMLCKMPAACTVALLASAFSNTSTPSNARARLLAVLGMGVAMMLSWYFVWVPWAEKEFGFPLFFPTSISEGWKQLVDMKVDTLSRFYPIALTSRLAFIFCLAGIGFALWDKHKPLLLTFAASLLLLFALMLKAGGTFSGHVYYIIPFVPMMALLAGYGLDRAVPNRWLQLAILILVTGEAIWYHKSDFFIPWQDQKYKKLENIVDQHVPKESRILVNNCEGSPVMLYAAHRRGWTVTDRMKDSSWVAGESTVGMDYLVIERSRWQDTLPFPKLYEDNEFQIYKTKKH
ncbi:MAG TPA: glycosyltransferase family 39 protein [Saprospiraceae bacterium]|nr:glycosyltransferase family 39 protein [Saprospiraceae bacterium]